MDWRTQFPPDSRQNIINRIMKTLQKHLPFSGPEGPNELRRIASRFEEKIFSGAVNQTDYLRKISMKMLSMESNSRNETGNLMYTSNRKPSFPNEQPTTETGDWRTHLPTGDWRTQLPPDSRQKIVNKIMETLKKHLPFSGPEGINELWRIASRFEEKIFSSAVNQTDYLRRISMKMLITETGDWRAQLPTGDWRTQLPPDLRQKIVNNIMETLKKHLPVSGPEELRRIASRFEENIFSSAVNQTDYLRKISMKMLIPMKTKL